jgi:ribosomal-protein-alanine N-acetyltransferase
VLIRSANAEDTACLVAIDAAVSSHPWRQQQFAAGWPRERGAALPVGRQQVELAQVGDAVAGFVVFMGVFDEGTILNIAVRPDFQGQGIGRSLLEHAMAVMARQGVQRCLLEVRASNKTARRLYRALGFAIDGQRRDYYPCPGGREDAVLMSCVVRSSNDEYS